MISRARAWAYVCNGSGTGISSKRAALIACVNGGSLHRRRGVWTAPSAGVGDRPISGATVADLGRDGMLTLSVLQGSAYARLTARGSWFARTLVTELAERAVPCTE